MDASLDDAPKALKKVVDAMEQKTRTRGSPKTIKRLSKQSPIWKRLKQSPAHPPEPQQYSRQHEMLARVQARASHGAGELWYVDGAGFCLEPSRPYAWQPLGTSSEVPTSSHSRRLHVLGFLKRHNDLSPDRIAGRRDPSVMIECFAQCSAQMDKKSDVWRDKAPRHRAKAFRQRMPQWVKQGFRIKYVPSYAPELNRSEMRWRFITYSWLPFSAYTSFQSLCKAVEDILTRFGTAYTITFQAA